MEEETQQVLKKQKKIGRIRVGRLENKNKKDVYEEVEGIYFLRNLILIFSASRIQSSYYKKL